MRTAFVSLIALAGLATAANAQPAPPAEAAAAPAPAAAPGEPPPVMPTSGPEAQIIDVINRVCKPLVKGGDFDQLASATGYKKNKREGTYVGTLVEKPYTITIWPQGSNKDVCRLTVNYALDGEKPIIVGLNIFSYLHDPRLEPQRNDFVPGAEFKRITNSWEYYTDKESTGLVFVQLKKLDGTSVNKNFDTGEILYSERKF
jgi:anaerobic selenocysteine-containing dehydrogenase